MAYLLGEFTEPGISEKYYVKHFTYNEFILEISNINTSVTFNFEHTLDGINWKKIETTDITLTENGTAHFLVNTDYLIESVRFNFISELGGTSAVIKAFHIGR